MNSPNVWVNWLQFVTSVGALAGPRRRGRRRRRRPCRRPRSGENRPPPPRRRHRATGTAACVAPSLRKTSGRRRRSHRGRAHHKARADTRSGGRICPNGQSRPAPTAAPIGGSRRRAARRPTIERMIHDVDQLLEKLVKRDALNGSAVELVFEAPTKDWVARRSGPAVDLYLYDIREDLQRRVPAWEDVTDGQGGHDGPPPAAAALPPGVPRHGLDAAARGRAPPAVGAARRASSATR